MDVDPFLEAVREVLAGGTVVDASVVDAMLGRRRTDNPVDWLSPRRRQTLALMAQGGESLDWAALTRIAAMEAGLLSPSKDAS